MTKMIPRTDLDLATLEQLGGDLLPLGVVLDLLQRGFEIVTRAERVGFSKDGVKEGARGFNVLHMGRGRSI